MLKNKNVLWQISYSGTSKTLNSCQDLNLRVSHPKNVNAHTVSKRKLDSSFFTNCAMFSFERKCSVLEIASQLVATGLTVTKFSCPSDSCAPSSVLLNCSPVKLAHNFGYLSASPNTLLLVQKKSDLSKVSTQQ